MGTSIIAQGDTYVNQSSTPPGGANGQIQYNNNGAFGGYTAAQAQGAIFPSATYATLPAASGYTGKQAFATDIGSSGIFVQSDGTRWKPVNGVLSLFQNNTPFVLTGTTVETTAYTITLPAGFFGPNDRIEFDYYITNSNSANEKQLLIRSGANLIANWEQTVVTIVNGKFIFRAANSQTSQLTVPGTASPIPYFSGTPAAKSTTVDTTVSWSLNINLSVGATTDTISLLGFSALLVTV